MKNLVILIFLLAAPFLNAQVNQEWIAQYFGEDSSGVINIPTAMVVDNSGNVVVTGYTNTQETGYDFVTIKFSHSGEVLWRAIYNDLGNSSDKAVDVGVDGLGNVIITGNCASNVVDAETVTIKYNSNGTLQWIKKHGENDNFANNIIKNCLYVCENGDIFISSMSRINSNQIGSSTIKYNSNGETEWIMNHPNHDPYGMAVDNSGNITITGRRQLTGGGYDYLTLKLSSSGNFIWEANYNGSNNETDIPWAITIDKFDNSYVTGGSNTNFDILTVKYDSSGNEIWTSRYSGTGNGPDIGRSIVVDDSLNVYVAGTTFMNESRWDLKIIGIDQMGNIKWDRSMGETNPSFSFGNISICADESGYVYVSGQIESDTNSWDFATTKYDKNGNTIWNVFYDYIGSFDFPSDLVVDRDGFVYITGASLSNGIPLTTIKYSQTVGINSISSEIPDKFILHQNYPNPFNPATKIKFDLPKAGLVSLKIYNLLGQQVSELVNQNLNAGIYEYTFEGAGLTSGIYFYRLETGGFVETKRMLLVK